MRHINYFCLSSFLLLGGVYFLFPIPHTVALRNLLLLILVGITVALLKKARSIFILSNSVLRHIELRALTILTGWLLLTLLWATDRAFSFDNYLSEWLGSLFVAWLGYTLAGQLANPGLKSNADQLVIPVLLALFAHGLWMLVFQVWLWSKNGSFPFGATPFGEYAALSTSINMAFSLLLADAVYRWLNGNRIYPWSNRLAAGLLIFCTIFAITAKARNGIITILVMLVIAMLVQLREQRERLHFRGRLAAVVAIMIVATSLLTLNFVSDKRWERFAESVAVAYDTKTNLAWLDGGENGLPVLSDDQIADHSAYMRIAWAKVAVEGIAHRPFGYGYGLGGFGHYLEEVYGRYGAISSHSGILDFTLANGIPGLILLLIFVALLFRRGWLSWCSGNPWGLALMLSLTNYFVRILLDGHFGGFRLKMIALLLGILYWLTLNKPKPATDA